MDCRPANEQQGHSDNDVVMVQEWNKLVCTLQRKDQKLHLPEMLRDTHSMKLWDPLSVYCPVDIDANAKQSRSTIAVGKGQAHT